MWGSTKYPLLAIHPRNLVPVCLECNQRFKREEDPLTHNDSVSLTHSFHPFSSTAAIDVIQVKCQCHETGQTFIVLEDGENSPNSTRLETLDRVLKLEERWTNRLDEVKETLYEKVSGWQELIMRLQDKDMQPDELEDQLRDAIEGELTHKQIGRQINRIVYESYIYYILENDNEFELLASISN